MKSANKKNIQSENTKKIGVHFKNIFEAKKVLSFLSWIWPYLAILAASIIPYVIFFRIDGYINGDDAIWHLNYTYDLYAQITSGHWMSGPSHILLGSLSPNIYLFYGPFPHYLVVFFKIIFSTTLSRSLEFFTILSVFVSGIWMYHLGKEITNNKLFALVGAIAYCFFPYRILNFLYRAAFNEGFAFAFYPLLFLGIYKILHDKEFRISAYIQTILAVALLLLSHPFSALVGCVLAGAYILFSWKGLKLVFTNKKKAISVFISLILILGMVSFYLFPMFEATESGIYRISDPIVMWTNVPHLISYLPYSLNFSGFFYSSWLTNWIEMGGNAGGETPTTWLIDVLCFIGCSLSAVFILLLGEKKRSFKLWAFIIATALLAIPLLITRREEVYIGTALFYILLIAFELTPKEELIISPWKREVKETLKSPENYILLIFLIIIFLLITTATIWNYVPEIFLNAQFPFRFFGIFGFGVIILLFIVLKPWAHRKKVQQVTLVFACLLYIVSLPSMDKRLWNLNGFSMSKEPSEASLMNVTRVGWNNEYVPIIFYDSSYTSEYASSLYPLIRTMITTNHDFAYDKESYLTPAFLLGEGTFQITNMNSPDATFIADITSDTALVQIPQIYYDGYEVKCYALDTDELVYFGEVQNIDALVSFSAKKGTYRVELKYIGSKSYRIALPFFFISVSAVISWGIGETIYAKKKKRKTNLLVSK